ncbi:MAG: flagellar basal body L-ring protein FlgH [Pseudorhizobium sp.]
MKRLTTLSIAAFAVTACASSPHETVELAPAKFDTYQGPWASEAEAQTGPENASLWSTSSDSLLSMRRAKDVGDLLTVLVEMNDQASLQSSLTRSRDSSEDMEVNSFLGLPEWANGVLPGGASLSPAYDYNRASDLSGSGAVNRAEKVTFTLAARVVGVEPNGNLIIRGYQQTQVSNEVRYLTVSGVIRAQDVTRTNTVSYEKIADAQLAYVSSGEATSNTEMKTIPKLLDRYNPF